MESSTMREAFEEIQRLSDDPATRVAAMLYNESRGIY